MFGELRSSFQLTRSLRPIAIYLERPIRIFRRYDRNDLRFDILAALTVTVILLPQAIAYSVIAELPPQMGLYTAVVAAIVGALWGSSNHSHTGPINTLPLLVLSSLLTVAEPGTVEYIVSAGLLAIMAGVFQLVMGMARLGVLVNFVSHSVIVGFASGAGILIAIKQVRSLLGLQFADHNLSETLQGIITGLPDTDPATAAIGISTVILIVFLKQIKKNLPAALISMTVASVVVFALHLDDSGVAVIGKLPSGLPPLVDLSFFNLDRIARLSSGALAIGAIGLVQTSAISRSIAAHSGQRLDSNQEFVGQGLANIVAGLFSGYPSAGSFTRSAVNFSAGARTPLSAAISGIFVLIAMVLLAPLAAYLPRAALAGVLIVVAYSTIDRKEIGRIWQGARGDAVIMVFTLLGTLFLHIEFAVLLGILLSFALYIMRTSTPRVHPVLPDENFRHFSYQPSKEYCPQLAIIDILGDLYFGAVNHVEESIHRHLEQHPEQRFLLIRMHNVNHCDFSGIHMLESVVRMCRERGGDVYMVSVGYRVDKLMKSTGFCDFIGTDNYLSADDAIGYLFHHKLDPAICIYECPVRAFKECQNLPKQILPREIAIWEGEDVDQPVKEVTATDLWEELRGGNKAISVIDVREPREFQRGHIPNAELVPLPEILAGKHLFERAAEHKVVFVCRSGRRSRRAALKVGNGNCNAEILKGGMVAWEAAGLLEAID